MTAAWKDESAKYIAYEFEDKAALPKDTPTNLSIFRMPSAGAWCEDMQRR